MRNILSTLLTLLLTLTLHAQTTIEEWSAAVGKFGVAIPQEKVFLHTDNQCYFLGDTIFYRAYLTRTDKRLPSNISGVLYVELLNADGYLVERQQVQMKSGMGTGTIVLDTTTCLYAGYYEIRAYTRWQLNWGQTTYPHTKWSEKWFFKRSLAKQYYNDYEKLYSRVIPVYDHPLSPGDYTRDMSVRPMQRLFSGEDKSGKTSVKLYPEGGTLLAGAPCRAAFEAISHEGRHLRGKLQIKNGSELVAEAKTEHRGRGTVTFTPQAGHSYSCSFIADNGDSYRVKMPDVATTGVSLTADVTPTTLDIKAVPSGLAPDEQVGLTVMCSGVVACTINLSADGTTHSLPLAKLPVGVLDITVFNNEGRVYADRLVFNPGEPGTLNGNTLTISGAEKFTQPYKPITLTINSPQQKAGIISLSVVDAATTDNICDNGTILTEMLLASEIRGFVEDPGYYFEAEDDTHRRALDLLMMVQGWRRFDWHLMAVPKQHKFALTHPNETHTPIMTGSVMRYRAEQTTDIFQQMAEADVEAYMADRDEDPWADEPEEGDDPNIATTTTYDALAELNKEDGGGRYQNGELRQEAEKAEDRFDNRHGGLKREVLVHAEFSQPGSETHVGEMATEKGRFRIELPLFDGECYFFLSASDSTKWSKKHEHKWVVPNPSDVRKRDYPEFYVHIDQPYPRFAHPYNFYQTAHADTRVKKTTPSPVSLYDDNQLAEITVRVRRSGLRAFDKHHPAFVVDALKAFNYTIDAGLCTGQFLGAARYCNDVARAYIGDMNLERQYVLQTRYDDLNTSANLSEGVLNSYNDIARLDRIKVYTDFSPRHMGDSRWAGSDQPTVLVNLIRMPNDGSRITYRDRRLILQGFSICEDFYNPDYSTQALPSKPDFRRTLYWNPALRLDSNGQATVTLYRNARPGQIVVTANGFSTDGSLLTGEAR